MISQTILLVCPMTRNRLFKHLLISCSPKSIVVWILQKIFLSQTTRKYNITLKSTAYGCVYKNTELGWISQESYCDLASALCCINFSISPVLYFLYTHGGALTLTCRNSGWGLTAGKTHVIRHNVDASAVTHASGYLAHWLSKQILCDCLIWVFWHCYVSKYMFFVLQIIELCVKASIVLTVLSVKQYKGCMN